MLVLERSVRRVALAALAMLPAIVVASAASGVMSGAEIIGSDHDVSPPMFLMPPSDADQVSNEPEFERAPLLLPGRGGQADARAPSGFAPRWTDPSTQSWVPSPLLPSVNVNIPGLGKAFTGYSVAGDPPDTNGDIGPNHYVQAVNAAYVIFKKSGTKLAGPTNVNQLFSGFTGGGGLCASTNQGDPVVLYDPLADRWFITQFAFNVNILGSPVAPFYQCVAVSTSGDPTGSYNRYAFGPFQVGSTSSFNDYGKFGVWPDGYYASFNMFNGATTFAGAKLCVMDRVSMLAGTTATMQCFQLYGSSTGGYGGILPADLDGALSPPAGEPGIFLGDDNTPVASGGKGNVLQLWRLKVDWTTPANSTITNTAGNCSTGFSAPCPDLIPVTAFRYPCNNAAFTLTCVPQHGTTNQLDTLGDRLMFRLAYRNMGPHESLVFNRTVEPSANAPTGSRWYELQNASGQTFGTALPVVAQQSSYVPGDGAYRWMGSVAMDQAGNMALGFSKSNADAGTNNIAVSFTGRLATDTASTMPQGEADIFAASGNETGDSRWGDYSSMVVDPSDQCSFWYTQELMVSTGEFVWDTRIGSFKFNNCATKYVLSGLPANVTRNQPVTVTITAVDGSGATVTGYNGSASMSSTDAAAIFSPATVSFTNGVGTVVVTFKTTGAQSVTATDTSSWALKGSASTTVAAYSTLTGYAVVLPASSTAGVAVSFSVNAVDAYGNTVPTYAGTAHFTSSDGTATLPANATFASGTVGPLSATFRISGSQSLTATDTTTSSITGSGSTTVSAAAATHYAIVGLPATATAGTAVSFSVKAFDQFNNLATGYTGTAHFTSSDTVAVLPANTAFVSGATGSLSVNFHTSGTQSLTATDASNASIAGTASSSVSAGIATHYAIVGLPSTATAGTAVSFSVNALDAFNNLATGYSGTAHFTSSDTTAALPANTAFTSGATASLSVNFHTSGSQSITATDTASASITGTASSTVSASAATHYAIVGIPATATAGTAVTFTVHALDQFNNLATGYSGSAHFTSSDVVAVLPANAAFASGTTGTLSVNFHTAGSQSITATDTSSASIAGTASTSVSAAAATHYAIVGLAAGATAGVATTFSVHALDPFGNVATGYGGTAHFTSSDTGAALPVNTTLASGVTGTLSVTFHASGTQSITATDTASASITGSASTAVAAASATHYAIVGLPSGSTAGTAAGFTLKALDTYGNLATSYGGTAHFTSTDSGAGVPADTTLAGGISSALSVTFHTAGTQSITATDTANASISATASSTVSAAAATGYAFVGLASTATAGSATTFTLHAVDAYGNTDSTYAGTAHFTSGDAQAALPANTALTAGVSGSLSATFKTSGNQSVTATDISLSTLTATRSVAVSAAAVNRLEIANLAASVAQGVATTFDVHARDAFGNIATGYAGTVAITSSDGSAVLPSNQTLSAGTTSGVSITLRTGGSQTVTATDTSSSSLNASGSTNVIAAPTVSITQPSSGATITGSATVSASATPGSGTTISRVDLYVDGSLIGSASSANASTSWDSTTVTNGTHAVTAKAYDVVGGSATSAAISISVSNTTLVADGGSGDGGSGGNGGTDGGSGGNGSGGGAGVQKGCSCTTGGSSGAQAGLMLAAFGFVRVLTRRRRA